MKDKVEKRTKSDEEERTGGPFDRSVDNDRGSFVWYGYDDDDDVMCVCIQ
jgi:hypothetical protein